MQQALYSIFQIFKTSKTSKIVLKKFNALMTSFYNIVIYTVNLYEILKQYAPTLVVLHSFA